MGVLRNQQLWPLIWFWISQSICCLLKYAFEWIAASFWKMINFNVDVEIIYDDLLHSSNPVMLWWNRMSDSRIIIRITVEHSTHHWIIAWVVIQCRLTHKLTSVSAFRITLCLLIIPCKLMQYSCCHMGPFRRFNCSGLLMVILQACWYWSGHSLSGH